MKKGFFAILILVCLSLFTAGCGGGGGSVKEIKGLANIHSNSLHPMIGILRSDGENFSTVSRASLKRSSYEWQDVEAKVAPPKEPQYTTLYAIAVYNDKDDDGKYDVSELLGFADEFLRYNSNTDSWQITYRSGSLKWDDAFEHDGKDNFYVNCLFSRGEKFDPEAAEAAVTAELQKIHL